MKKYLNNETGIVWTETEVKEACKQFYGEAGYSSPEEYFEVMLDKGMITEVEE